MGYLTFLDLTILFDFEGPVEPSAFVHQRSVVLERSAPLLSGNSRRTWLMPTLARSKAGERENAANVWLILNQPRASRTGVSLAALTFLSEGMQRQRSEGCRLL